jgi:hypothetical protein
MPQPVEQLLAIVPDPLPAAEPVTAENTNTVISLDVAEPVLNVAEPAQPAEPTA